MTVCAICGINEATTRDHVPQKAIFQKPRPENLITVPACSDCYNGASDLDDLFKVYLSMHAACESDIARRLFTEKTARTLERNKSLLSQIAEESKEQQIEDENGDFVTGTGILWNSEIKMQWIKNQVALLQHDYRRHDQYSTFPAIDPVFAYLL